MFVVPAAPKTSIFRLCGSRMCTQKAPRFPCPDQRKGLTHCSFMTCDELLRTPKVGVLCLLKHHCFSQQLLAYV